MHSLFHFAYLDAGTGSLIIQSLIGLFAGALVFGRRVLMKFRARTAKLLGKAPPTPETAKTDSKSEKTKPKSSK